MNAPPQLLDAVIAETVEGGYADLSVERISRRAGVSEASFHAHFADKQAAAEAAQRYLFEEYLNRLLATCEVQPSWPLKVKAGICVTLELAAASPVKARFLSLDTVAADPALTRQVFEAQDRLARLLASGRRELSPDTALPAITEQALIAGMAATISARLVGGEAEQLPALAPQLVELTLLPYLGAERAAATART